jgi:hypothetical protein
MPGQINFDRLSMRMTRPSVSMDRKDLHGENTKPHRGSFSCCGCCKLLGVPGECAEARHARLVEVCIHTLLGAVVQVIIRVILHNKQI